MTESFHIDRDGRRDGAVTVARGFSAAVAPPNWVTMEGPTRQRLASDLLRRVSDTNSLRLQARQIDSELVQLDMERGIVSPKCALSDPRGRQGLPLWRVTGRPFIV